jgi:hypothetical protein
MREHPSSPVVSVKRGCTMKTLVRLAQLCVPSLWTITKPLAIFSMTVFPLCAQQKLIQTAFLKVGWPW